MSSFWEGLSDDELRRGYALRDMVPDHPALFAAYDRDSAAAYESLEVVRDIAYGDHPRQRADVFQAVGGEQPCLVFIHGGFWQSFAKESFAFIAPAYVEAGISVVTFSYALCPEVSLTALTAQVREGMAWLGRRARDYGIDPARIHVSGHSAGGHLAAMMALTDWAAYDLDPAPVASIVALSGLFDLRPLLAAAQNQAIGLDAAEAEALSPALHAAQATRAVPALFAVGGDEGGQMLGQQRAMVDAWAGPTEALELPGVHHFSIVRDVATPGQPLFERVRGRILG